MPVPKSLKYQQAVFSVKDSQTWPRITTQIFSYNQSIFVCHIQPKYFFNLCLHKVSKVSVLSCRVIKNVLPELQN